MSKVIKAKATTNTVVSVPQPIKSKYQLSQETKFSQVSIEPPPQLIIDRGQCDQLQIPAESSMIVTITPSIPLLDTYKILVSIVSNDAELGGLSCYIKEYSSSDSTFSCFVENLGDNRAFWLNWLVVA